MKIFLKEIQKDFEAYSSRLHRPGEEQGYKRWQNQKQHQVNKRHFMREVKCPTQAGAFREPNCRIIGVNVYDAPFPVFVVVAIKIAHLQMCIFR
jgi:hypothetical protein